MAVELGAYTDYEREFLQRSGQVREMYQRKSTAWLN